MYKTAGTVVCQKKEASAWKEKSEEHGNIFVFRSTCIRFSTQSKDWIHRHGNIG